MCTISYLPNPEKNGEFTVVNNRDESVNRPAELPRLYKEYNTVLYYPKDKRGGGTWIGLSRKKRLMSLMNGAFFRHKRQPSYRKSRGVVVKELLAADNMIEEVKNYDFTGIEPFFGIVFSWEKEMAVFELIWDGREIQLHFKDIHQPKIWSAAMTYSPKQHAMREKKFKHFLTQNKSASDLTNRLWDFHHDKGDRKQEGVLINRGELQTTSVSQFWHNSKIPDTFRFEDLILGEEQQESLKWL